METIIKTESLTKIYNPLSLNPKLALDQVSLDVKEGEFIAIMGKSGSGKTTLLNILSTIDDLTKGKLFIYGKNIYEMSETERAHFRKENIGFIFQNFNLLDTLTVKENIILPLKLAGKIIDEEDFKQIIKDLEIDDLLDKYPFECSGGQSQRVAVARTLVMHPKIIFADEPTGNLDGVRSKQLMQYLEKVNREKNITVIMVTHDPLDAAYSSQMYYIEDGKIKDVDVLYEVDKDTNNVFRVSHLYIEYDNSEKILLYNESMETYFNIFNTIRQQFKHMVVGLMMKVNGVYIPFDEFNF